MVGIFDVCCDALMVLGIIHLGASIADNMDVIWEEAQLEEPK